MALSFQNFLFVCLVLSDDLLLMYMFEGRCCIEYELCFCIEKNYIYVMHHIHMYTHTYPRMHTRIYICRGGRRFLYPLQIDLPLQGFMCLVHSRCQISVSSFPPSSHLFVQCYKINWKPVIPPLCVSFSAANPLFNFTVFHSSVGKHWVQQKIMKCNLSL